LPEGRDLSEEEITLALTCKGTSSWVEGEFQNLLYTLGCAGYGWLRPDGVRKKLEKLPAEIEEERKREREERRIEDEERRMKNARLGEERRLERAWGEYRRQIRGKSRRLREIRAIDRARASAGKIQRRKEESIARRLFRENVLEKPLLEQIRVLAKDEMYPVTACPINPRIISVKLLKELDEQCLRKLSDRISGRTKKCWKDLASRLVLIMAEAEEQYERITEIGPPSGTAS
jgi:hypothetical protein